MKRKPNKPQQEPRERPGSWEEPADPGGASSGAAGDGSPGGAGAEGTSGQSVHKSKFRQKSKQEQAAASDVAIAVPHCREPHRSVAGSAVAHRQVLPSRQMVVV